MVEFTDDMLFEQFSRRDEDDFDGMAKMIAERLREGINERGAKWLADLFDPSESKPRYRVKIFRPDQRTKKGERDDRLEFELFKELLEFVDYDFLKAKDIAKMEPPNGNTKPPNINIENSGDYIKSLGYGEGLGFGINKADRIAKEVREYLYVKWESDSAMFNCKRE
jgi:hypothetical protein